MTVHKLKGVGVSSQRPVVAELSTDNYSLNFEQLCVSVPTMVHRIKRGLGAALIYEFKDTDLESRMILLSS